MFFFGFNQHVCPSVPLFCYTCVFPAISPLDCIRFPLRCPPGQVCLSSRAVGEKGEGASCHWTKFKWIKTEKKNRENVSMHSSRWVGVVDFFSFSLQVSSKLMFPLNFTLLTFRRLPCGAVREKLHPAFPVWSHGWKIHHGPKLHLHQWMLQHTSVQQSCYTHYLLLDCHIAHTTYFILSVVNKAMERTILIHMKQVAFPAL